MSLPLWRKGKFPKSLKNLTNTATFYIDLMVFNSMKNCGKYWAYGKNKYNMLM